MKRLSFGLLFAGMVAQAPGLARAEPVPDDPRRARTAQQCPAIATGWLRPSDGLPDHRLVLLIRLRGNDILWGGQSMSRQELRTMLSRSRAMNPTPFILLDPSAAADCGAAAEIRDLIDESLDCGEAMLCGQGARREWDW
jgi:hypothetical protein